MRTTLLDRRVTGDDPFLEKQIQTLPRRALVTDFGFVIGLGLIGGGLVSVPALARFSLIDAGLGAVRLLREWWGVQEPPSGHVTIVNNFNEFREGDVYFFVVGPNGIESQDYLHYAVPPNMTDTYEFERGPYGLFPGQKLMNAQSARSRAQTPMVVEA